MTYKTRNEYERTRDVADKYTFDKLNDPREVAIGYDEQQTSCRGVKACGAATKQLSVGGGGGGGGDCKLPRGTGPHPRKIFADFANTPLKKIKYAKLYVLSPFKNR